MDLFGGGKGRGKGKGAAAAAPAPMLPLMEDKSLATEAQRRYLNYALSVITSRALPDVRDGLKPVQRRILYAMRELGLRPDVKYRKCALVVGDVLGKFHPHGDSSVYDAMVRLAQSFTMQAMLVDGRGNFGSADGDGAAAYRYTEARLQPIAMELLAELDKETVHFRPNFDNTRMEPAVLPARFPHLLVNGSQGIAVGMATSIPPHNFGEVIDAAVALIDDPDLPVPKLLKYIKGPDFPTGGQLLSSRAEMNEVYSTGQGSFKLRGEWQMEETKRGPAQIVIHSIPYAVERRTIVEKIAEVIMSKKLPVLTDVRDESTDITRLVLEIKKDTDPQLVMAYLYKHTPLATNVQVNLTCLVPTENVDVPAPKRLDLGAMLRAFLAFRFEVVTKRLTYDLSELKRRIHMLEGFEIIFDVLDETIRIIRKSSGKKDAAEKLMKRFSLDAEQVDAILELKLYRLAQLEINLIREELAEKRNEAARLGALVKSESARWKLIRAELLELKTTYPIRRHTKVGGAAEEPEYDADAFIVDEDAMVVLTQQGWIKRQREVKDVSATRTREGDQVLDVVAGGTKSSIAFFSNTGVCYVCRIVDVPATTGYGDPIQKMFKMADGERIIAMMSFDPRVREVPAVKEGKEEPEPPYALVVTKDGMSLRFSLRAHRETSTRAGRRFARLREGDEVVFVGAVDDDQKVAVATVNGHALICESEEVALLSGAGKGVILIKLQKDDTVLAAALLTDKSDALVVQNESDRKFEISTRKYEITSRAGKARALQAR
ncbi:MAG: DNA topoisomerase IV subunit A [Sandaracinaceae bacterium]|nr:DNA topoisomerase IV subunit A [Sandaracinaceae bacterium]